MPDNNERPSDEQLVKSLTMHLNDVQRGNAPFAALYVPFSSHAAQIVELMRDGIKYRKEHTQNGKSK